MAQKPEKDRERGEPVEGLSGTIQRFTFRNPETGFAVVRFAPEDGSSPLSIVGTLAQLVEGQQLVISGERRNHPRFGPQIEVASAEAKAPGTIEGIRAYLASSLVKGIGPAMAERLTDAFGEDTLRVIEEEPERLRKVKGLGAKKARDLGAAIQAQRDIQDVMVFLRSHGLGSGLAVRIVRRLGKNASALIQANPYRLADEVIGIGFRTADRLAGSLGIEPDAPERIEAGCLYVLGNAAREGHCYLPQPVLEGRTSELLSCEPEAVAAVLPGLREQARVRIEQPPAPPVLGDDLPLSVYPLALHEAECGCAQMLDRLIRAEAPALPVDSDRALSWFEQRSGMSLPEGQRRAVTTALGEPVTVITGGPGVGKTTILRAITEILGKKDIPFLLAAPTGRAAKRLEQSTGRTATTIHRMLEFQAGINQFLRDARNPLEASAVVVDEASMLDVQLAYNLLRAIAPGTKLILVGDVHQLPAVGPGHVLGDLIESGRVPVVELTEVFRQHGESAIIRAAHQVLAGEVPEGAADGAKDFFFVEAKSSSHARVLIRELVQGRIPKAFDLDPLADIQVLCPMYRGEAGADAINSDLQQQLNPQGVQVERLGRNYRVGDKVMQIRNDYELEVYNGDAGRVTAIDPSSGVLQVDFGDRRVDYSFSELDQLVPAYAISVHRSQGSEYPAVVIPLATDHFLMLRRNLLYTAITRGKQLVVLVGSPKALAMAVRNHEEGQRYTGLCERLRAPLRA